MIFSNSLCLLCIHTLEPCRQHGRIWYRSNMLHVNNFLKYFTVFIFIPSSNPVAKSDSSLFCFLLSEFGLHFFDLFLLCD